MCDDIVYMCPAANNSGFNAGHCDTVNTFCRSRCFGFFVYRIGASFVLYVLYRRMPTWWFEHVLTVCMCFQVTLETPDS
jgi:hypothetical protein